MPRICSIDLLILKQNICIKTLYSEIKLPHLKTLLYDNSSYNNWFEKYIITEKVTTYKVNSNTL